MTRHEIRTKSYHNPWIPAEALRTLENEKGTILDVGGGQVPYWRASHVLDIQAFEPESMERNQWGNRELESGKRKGENCGRELDSLTNFASLRRWTASQHTQLDLCCGQRWPFDDKQFDLGLCSHCLEDIRDPLPAVRELSRVCKRVMVIGPSRLFEQIRGIDHPAYCGFYHHPWIMFEEDGKLIFRRKTSVLELKGCHVVCPLGWTLKRELGSMFILSENLQAEERAFWSEESDYKDYADFIRPYLMRRDLFVPDGRPHGLRYWIWRLRQRYLGRL
jgi:SAM-dependent methyltransferase